MAKNQNPYWIAERIIKFAEKYCVVPDGMLAGKPIKLDEFQKKFIRDCFRIDVRTQRRICKTGILSIARKNAKSTTIAIIALAALVGPIAELNAQTIAAANSKEQAAVIYTQLEKMVNQSEELSLLIALTPNKRRAVGLAMNTTFEVIAKKASTAYGRSPKLLIIDEAGQVIGPNDAFIDALTTATGAHSDSLKIYISTQAAADTDMLSMLIDDAANCVDGSIVCHVYAADPDCDLDDMSQIRKANPALGKFRDMNELLENRDKAKRLPSFESTYRNLYLNQRISLLKKFIAPTIWKKCKGKVTEDAFSNSVTSHFALDLSQRLDLTAAVIAASVDGKVLIHPYCFTPIVGVEERSKRDRAPYEQWIRDGYLIATPGSSVDYQWVAEFLALRSREKNFTIKSVQFDRWRMDLFKKDAEAASFATEADWVPVGQGYKDFSPRIEEFELLLTNGTLRHGDHPLLNMAAANAIAVADPARNRKLEKSKSSARIDPLVAAVMAAYAAVKGEMGSAEKHPEVTADSFFIIGKG
jgi:phage terminase large subunit-like protein